MKYASGTCGRVFYLHIEHGEELYPTLTTFVRVHEIRSGLIHLIGGIRKGRIVAGPKEDILPYEALWEPVEMVHEIIGTGFIRKGEDGPAVHIHISAGKGDRAVTGCLRDLSKVFIIIEAVIIEFTGIELPMVFDKVTGIPLPYPENQSPVS